jgi:hypothetical protein
MLTRSLFLFFIVSTTASAQPVLSIRDANDGPQTFAMIVGISKYKYVRPLTYADKDAELFRDFMRSPAGGNVSNDNIFFLLNEQASNSNFWIKGFQWLRTKTLKKGDRLFIYMAGHGDAIDENQFFFLGYDCNPRGDKNNYLVAGAIQLFNLKLKIASETAKGVEVFFIMDACRSNELPGGSKGQQSLSNAISEKKAGEIIMLAASAGQSSLEDATIGSGNGLFTYYLINGLLGIADSTGTIDNRVSFSEIENYVSNAVPRVAESQFRRVQQPFFCCADMRDHIISRVDTAYLKNWLKSHGRRGGNSLNGPFIQHSADTSLPEIYNLFSNAVSDNRMTGTNSAEAYYLQMENKFPGNAYTLDARSTLAGRFVDFAQERVDHFLDCGEFPGSNNNADYMEAASRLEKAINLLKKDEPQFSATYLSRLYFLKASSSFENAYNALALDQNAAFVNNLLAILHQKNNNPDSALYYAKRTVSLAPNWRCGYNTLSSVNRNTGLKDSTQKKNNPRPVWGIMASGGLSTASLVYSDWEQRNIDYHDSLNSIAANGGSSLGIGIFLQFAAGNKIQLRPAAHLSFENLDIVYNRKPATGAPFSEIFNIKTVSISLSLPLIYRIFDKNVSPYLSIAPALRFTAQDATSERLPLKRLGIPFTGAIGFDIRLAKGFLISPELSYTRTVDKGIDNINNLYTNTLASLHREFFLFKIYLRK